MKDFIHCLTGNKATVVKPFSTIQVGFTLFTGQKPLRESRGIALLFLDLGTTRG
jgi:hypothetical protein